MVRMIKKMNSKAKDFQDEAHMQGSKRVPLPAIRKYGTGLPDKKPNPKMASKKK